MEEIDWEEIREADERMDAIAAIHDFEDEEAKGRYDYYYVNATQSYTY